VISYQLSVISYQSQLSVSVIRYQFQWKGATCGFWPLRGATLFEC